MMTNLIILFPKRIHPNKLVKPHEKNSKFSKDDPYKGVSKAKYSLASWERASHHLMLWSNLTYNQRIARWCKKNEVTLLTKESSKYLPLAWSSQLSLWLS